MYHLVLTCSEDCLLHCLMAILGKCLILMFYDLSLRTLLVVTIEKI